jgi:hypothetical protein
MRLTALQSVMNAGSAGSSGCPRPRRHRGFPRAPVAPLPAPSPVPLRTRVHPLLSLASSSEFYRLVPAVRTDAVGAFLGVLFPIAASTAEIHLRAGSHPRPTSAPDVSHALDGSHPPLPRGLVSSRNHVRDSPFRGSFPPPSRPASSAARALLSLTADACRRLPRHSSTDDLAFRASIRAAIRCCRRSG